MNGKNYYLPPRVLQIVGIVLLIAFAIFWGVTGRESVLLVGTAGSLILLGGYVKAADSIREKVIEEVTEKKEAKADGDH